MNPVKDSAAHIVLIIIIQDSEPVLLNCPAFSTNAAQCPDLVSSYKLFFNEIFLFVASLGAICNFAPLPQGRFEEVMFHFVYYLV